MEMCISNPIKHMSQTLIGILVYLKLVAGASQFISRNISLFSQFNDTEERHFLGLGKPLPSSIYSFCLVIQSK